MKVLYISGMYPTPAYPQKGIFCHEQVKALKKCGVDVDVIVPMTVYDREHTAKVWEYEGVTVRYIRYFKLPGATLFQKIGQFLYHALLRAKVDFKQYDVIHADAPLPSGYAAMRLSEKYGTPFVVHCHGLDVFLDTDYGQCRNYPAIAEYVDQVYTKANAIVGVSSKTLKNVIARLPVQQKSYVVYNGVDVERFHPGDKKKTDSELRIISVGNLIDLKGHDLSIMAVSRLLKEGYKGIWLDIYGRGGKEDQLKAQAEELGVAEYVTFRGYVKYDHIAIALRQYDVFLLPSWYEAIGCVYLEAMASGLVTIGCWEQGIDEVIKDGENGFLLHPHSVDDIVNVIKGIYCAEERDFTRMAQKARRTVAEEYTWQESAQSLIKVYRQII